jgi:GAF domain-containing protein
MHRSSVGPGGRRRLLDAVIAVGEEPDLPAILTRVVEQAAELTDAEHGALGIVTASGDLIDTVGTSRAALGHAAPVPAAAVALTYVLDQPGPLRLADLDEAPELASALGAAAPDPDLAIPFLGLPVVVRGSVFGALWLTGKRTGEVFTDVDEELATGLVSAAAISIENARLRSEQRHHLKPSADDRRVEAIVEESRRALEAVATQLSQVWHDAMDERCARDVERLAAASHAARRAAALLGPGPYAGG